MAKLIHRDVSWLAFNHRVLQEAMDSSVPLLERLKFLAIYSSNLDEFFRIRVANHRNLVRANKSMFKNIDFSPEIVLKDILKIANEQQKKFSEIFEKNLLPELKKNGIQILSWHHLNKEQIEFVDTFFNENLLPFVQPVILAEKKNQTFPE